MQFMTQSMTGFARTEEQLPWCTLSCEIRTVNQRFLDPNFRLPENLREHEPALRDILRKRIQRGKVECSFRLTGESQQGSEIQLNQQLAQQLLRAVTEINTITGESGVLNPMELLKWPGMLQEEEGDRDTLKQAAIHIFETTLDQLIAMRNREGDELQKFIIQRLDEITTIVKDIRTAIPAILAANKERLLSKLAEFKDELDPVRLEQEITLIAQKADVDEELDRLETHLLEVRNILESDGAVGRKLDFLMQELNREANTISSKAIVADTSLQSVELKVLIEQMREQIQNIE
jgi:uncharacterized protein (TIGR00255 family)